MDETGAQLGVRLLPISVNPVASRNGEIVVAKEVFSFQDQDRVAVWIVSKTTGKEFNVVVDLAQAEALGLAMKDVHGEIRVFNDESFVLLPWNIRTGKLTRSTSRELAESFGFFDETFLSLVERGASRNLKVEEVQAMFREIDPIINPLGPDIRQAIFLQILNNRLHPEELRELMREIHEGAISLEALEGFGYRKVPQNLPLRSAEARLLAWEFGFKNSDFLNALARSANELLTVRQARETFQEISPVLKDCPESIQQAVFLQIVEGRIDWSEAREMSRLISNGELALIPAQDGTGYVRQFHNSRNNGNGSGTLHSIVFGLTTLLTSSETFAATGKAVLENGFNGLGYLATAGALFLLGMSAGPKGGKPRGPDTIQRRNNMESVLIDPKQPIELRSKAAKLLAERKDEFTTDLLVKFLGDSKQPVQLRYSVLLNIHRTAPQATIDPAIKILQDSNESLSLRYRALYILQQANLPELSDIVNNLISNPRENPAFKLSLRAGK